MPELSAYLDDGRKLRKTPYHPTMILREHLRAHSYEKGTSRLNPENTDHNKATIFREYAKYASNSGAGRTVPWGARDVEVVNRKMWRELIAGSLELLEKGTRNAVVASEVRSVMEDAIGRTFEVAEAAAEEAAVRTRRRAKAAENENPGIRGGPGRRPREGEGSPRLSKKKRGKQPAKPAWDEESDSDISVRLDGRISSSDPELPMVQGSFNHSKIAGNVGISKDGNDVGVNVAVNVSVHSSPPTSPSPKVAGGPSKRQSELSKNKNPVSKSQPVHTPSTLLPFDEFPLLTLSVKIFHTTSLITAETFTTWDDVQEKIAALIDEPDLTVTLVGTGGDNWDGPWDAELWEDIKADADHGKDCPVYKVKLKFGKSKDVE